MSLVTGARKFQNLMQNLADIYMYVYIYIYIYIFFLINAITLRRHGVINNVRMFQVEKSKN